MKSTPSIFVTSCERTPPPALKSYEARNHHHRIRGTRRDAAPRRPGLVVVEGLVDVDGGRVMVALVKVVRVRLRLVLEEVEAVALLLRRLFPAILKVVN